MLTAVEREVLAIEALPWRRGAAKERHATQTLGLSPWRYAIVLNALLDKPAAVEHSPVLVNRLLRARRGRRG